MENFCEHPQMKQSDSHRPPTLDYIGDIVYVLVAKLLIEFQQWFKSEGFIFGLAERG